MQENATVLQGILDIEPLMMPLFVVAETKLINIILLILMIIALGLLVVFVRYRYFSVRGRACRELVALQKTFERNNFSSHKTVFLLADILRRGLQLHKISIETILPEKLDSQESRWLIFIDTLYVERYSLDGADSSQIDGLFVDARYWLDHWPTLKIRND